MAVTREIRPLKVCATCGSWSYTYKGLCSRLNQGVGKFWTCEDWLAADDRVAPAAAGTEAPIPPAS